ncbi:serine hydrolase domain-containing protein [Microbacterium chocolatum]|uniref:serine hydrolase domain-containing protein n=1 Tax=Microbacterium aurantiacum TaxID=162393 RepID=UPI00338F15B5
MAITDFPALFAALDDAARGSGFDGVVSVDVDGDLVGARAYGFADRAFGVANTVDTRFGVASIAKGFTAVAVRALIADGTLSADTAVRGILRDDLPLIDDAVTVEQLLTHTSGIGDYLDESGDGEVTDYVLDVPTHRLDTTEAFLAVLDGRPQVSAPGTAFAYNNSGYVVLALVAERASGIPFHDLVEQRVFAPAGMERSGYLRMDTLPGDAARGYLFDDDDDRTNVLHLPVRGSGDGGVYTTAADLSRFWRALSDGTLLPKDATDDLVRPRETVDEEDLRYGAGFWLDLDGPGMLLEGYDAGVSGRSRFDPETRATVSIVANTSEGAWPVIERYVELTG